MTTNGTALTVHEPAEMALREASVPACADVGFTELLTMAEALVPTGFLPDHIKTPGQAVAIILTGRELGMPPMRALRSLQMVKGKVVENADSQLSRFKSDGGRAQFRVLSETEAELWLRHPNGDEHVERFTIADAERAGLTKPSSRGEPSMYLKHPKAMLRSRVITAGLKSIGWEGGAGAYDPDEAIAFAPELRAGLDQSGGNSASATSVSASNVAEGRPDEPLASCPKCGGPMWDDRTSKRNPRAPDFKCKDRSCDGVYWPGQWPPKDGATETQIEALLTLTDRAECPEKVRAKVRRALERGITAEKAETWIKEIDAKIKAAAAEPEWLAGEEGEEAADLARATGEAANPQQAPTNAGPTMVSSEPSPQPSQNSTRTSATSASAHSSASNGHGARTEHPESRTARIKRIRELLKHSAIANDPMREQIERKLVNGMTDKEITSTLDLLQRAIGKTPQAMSAGDDMPFDAPGFDLGETKKRAPTAQAEGR